MFHKIEEDVYTKVYKYLIEEDKDFVWWKRF